MPAEAVFSFASQIITKRRNRLCGETVRHIMSLHDWGPSDGSKWMVGDGELGDATGDRLDDALDGSGDLEMTSDVELTSAEDPARWGWGTGRGIPAKSGGGRGTLAKSGGGRGGADRGT
jgi:hypothetical protein